MAKTDAGGGSLRGTPRPVAGRIAYYGLILAESVTLAGFLIVLGALSSLQKKANALDLDEATQAVYTEVFQSAGQVPYPTSHSKQWALQWYLLFGELVVFLTILALLAFPRHLLRFRAALIGLLVYFWALVTLQINSAVYFKHSPAANLVYGTRNVNAILAGAIVVAIANPLSIIFLGLLHEDNLPSKKYLAVSTHPTGKRVSDGDVPVAAAV